MEAKNVSVNGNVSVGQVSTVKPIEPLYIVGVVMSSPNQTLGSHWIDASQMTAEVEYKLTPDERKAISRVRARYGAVRDECVDYMNSGMFICRESQIRGPGDIVPYSNVQLTGYYDASGKYIPPVYPNEWGIEKKINVGARVCMEAIRPGLTANVRLIPIQSASTTEGELYEQIIASVRHQIYGDLFKRLQEVINMGKDKMLPKTKKSLIDKIENMRKANILNDPQIDQELDRFLKVVETEILTPLVKELDESINSLSSRFGMIRGGNE